ncbi:MAG: hypothetical protein EXS16_16335 [Gemmataceae bacterium]|nr:hypothetical protein [Gemmataceae bacterium]
MAIPERLKLQTVTKQLLDDMFALCDLIERELESGETAEVLLKRWHVHARRRCDPFEFKTYWTAISKETFVLNALNPEPRFDNDVVYAEALAVLDAVGNAAVPESEIQYYLFWLEAQFPNSNMSNLIYWPDEWFGDASLFREASGAFKLGSSLSNDQILGYAMAKAGRKLSGAPNGVVLPFPIPPSEGSKSS